MKLTNILAALIATLTGAAASAEPKAPPPPTSELSAPAQTGTSDPRYCLRSELTGSRILRRECHTVAQWKALDVDVLAAAKQ